MLQLMQKKNSVLPFAHADDSKDISKDPTFHITYAILSPQFVCNENNTSCSHVDIKIPLAAWIIPAIITSSLASLAYPMYRKTSKIRHAKTEFTKEERPFGTVGFIDIENSTFTFTRITTSERKKILADYYSTLGDILKKYDEDILIKKLGDGILFYFRNSCDEVKFDFKKVIKCCEEITEKCGVMKIKLENGKEIPLKFRISLVHGPLELFEYDDVVGSAVDLAAKINAKAVNGKNSY